MEQVATWVSVLGVGLVVGGAFRKNEFTLNVTKTTTQMQAQIVVAAKQHSDRNTIQTTALPGVPPTLCVPFRNGVGSVQAIVGCPEVGGKGLSLLQLAQVAEINVPQGFVLPVSFFETWTSAIRESEEFKQFLSVLGPTSSPAIKEACQKLKNLCISMKLTKEMKAAVTAGLKHIGVETSLVAIRSSSPEEDLVASSFAGGYETILGVKTNLADLATAIAQVFASCYDERVFIYKMVQGFSSAARDPKIAVVVQQQVHARAAGVCFSLNPLNNDQDVALINSSFGLGESVVSGLTSPDEFEVRHDSQPPCSDYAQRLTVERKTLGKKQLTISLGQDGGTVHSAESKNEFSITDEMAQRIVNQLMSIVKVYSKPMDTEWAVDQEGQLLWLQARPITAHFTVPRVMATAPGERKHLYLDVLSTVQGISGGLSILGCDFMGRVLNAIFRKLTGLEGASDRGPHNVPAVFSDRSLNACVSNGLAVAGKGRVVGVMNQMDMASARALAECDVSQYFPAHKPSFGFPWLPLRVLWYQPWFLIRVLRNWLSPEGAYARYEVGLRDCWDKLEEASSKFVAESKAMEGHRFPESPVEFTQRILRILVRGLLEAVIPAMGCGRILLARINSTVNQYQPGVEEQKRLSALTHGLPGNITLELSFRCEALARQLEDEGLWSSSKKGVNLSELIRELLAAISQSPRATQIWQELLTRYGHRSTEREIDVAVPKYHDNHASLLVNVLRIFDLSRDMRPSALQQRLSQERKEAAAFLQLWLERAASAHVARRFKALFKGYELLGGLRETHKYLLVKVMYICRLRYLHEGRWHHNAGRLDSVEDVFGLTLGDLEAAWDSRAPALDLRSLVIARRITTRKVGDPKLFDSRGKELRAKPSPVREGVIVGFPVSAGSGPVVGRTKTLHSPDEKPLLEGEVLVARATDPGWTPLFVPAAAVVLEVGGPLQHGALVAREYGKPCVVGIDGVVSKFPDGTLVRVDGILGTVELVKEANVCLHAQSVYFN